MIGRKDTSLAGVSDERYGSFYYEDEHVSVGKAEGCFYPVTTTRRVWVVLTSGRAILLPIVRVYVVRKAPDGNFVAFLRQQLDALRHVQGLDVHDRAGAMDGIADKNVDLQVRRASADVEELIVRAWDDEAGLLAPTPALRVAGRDLSSKQRNVIVLPFTTTILRKDFQGALQRALS